MEQHCKECRTLKALTEFYLHPQGINGVLGRCKECIKRGRRSEKERLMARIIDNKRSKTPERIEYSTARTRQYRKDNPLKYNAHKLVNNYYRYNKNDKPSICTYCGSESNIEMHHNDYNKPNEIIPLCSLCHSQYHNGTIVLGMDYIIVPF